MRGARRLRYRRYATDDAERAALRCAAAQRALAPPISVPPAFSPPMFMSADEMPLLLIKKDEVSVGGAGIIVTPLPVAARARRAFCRQSRASRLPRCSHFVKEKEDFARASTVAVMRRALMISPRFLLDAATTSSTTARNGRYQHTSRHALKTAPIIYQLLNSCRRHRFLCKARCLI